ncbi:MAG: TrkA family potassium uptake protein [Peptococcaceae bacterium]|jgi:trk system potassium uptake protein TrkA|nr:TrkA family potassium uptake protein [Peptococcaceae bacterium]MDH7525404.1 TrkA family potassium uptake protein [Peptococcaceae bacterium]
MRKQFAVIGLGRFGKSVALTLSELGHDVLAIDNAESNIQEVANSVTHAVQADAREEETLRALGIRNFDVVIVAIGNDIEANILITLMLKEMGVKFVVSKAMNALHGKVLGKIGADKIVFPEKDMGIRLAHNLVTFNVMDYIELAPGYSVLETMTPSRFVGKSLGELNLRARYGISVMAIKKAGTVVIAPGAGAVLEEKDILIVVGENEDLARLQD